jgi:hypothetical protein
MADLNPQDMGTAMHINSEPSVQKTVLTDSFSIPRLLNPAAKVRVPGCSQRTHRYDP